MQTAMRAMQACRQMSTAAKTIPRPPWTPPTTLKYPLRSIDPNNVTPSNWVKPMGGVDELPFRVFRTEKAKQVPVYTDYRNGRTKCLTIVRRIRGDVNALAQELSIVCDGNTVDIRPGRVEDFEACDAMRLNKRDGLWYGIFRVHGSIDIRD